jgi:hypothetical protein
MRERDKEPGLQRAATSWKREDVRQDLHKGFRTGDSEGNGRNFGLDAES